MQARVFSLGGNQTWDSGTLRAKIIPGKNYTVTTYADPGCNVTVTFQPVPGAEAPMFTLYLNGLRVTAFNHVAGGSSEYFSDTVGLYPTAAEMRDDDPAAMVSGLRGGAATSIVADKPIWYLGLGNMRNGQPAGAFGFRRPDFLGAGTFTPQMLSYDSPDGNEAERLPATGTLRQVYSREVLVDIITLSATSFRLDVYARADIEGAKQGDGLWHPKPPDPNPHVPFVTYTVTQITNASDPTWVPAGGNGIKITRVEDSATWVTGLVLGGSTWTLRDWRLTTASASANVATNMGATPVTVTVAGFATAGTPVGTAFVWNKTFVNPGWGLEVDKKTLGPTEAVKVETQYSYYTSTAGDGSLERRLHWRTNPDGSWERYRYCSPTFGVGTSGQIDRIYRPWLDGPAAPTSADTTNSFYEDWTYTPAEDGTYTLPYTRTAYAPNAVVQSKTTWTHNLFAGTLYSLAYVESVQSDFWGAGPSDYLTTTTRRFRSDVPTAYYRNKPVSIRYPDGRKESYAYMDGTWSEVTRSFTFDGTGSARAIQRFHGQTSGGTAISSWSVALDAVDMVANKSTISETIVDGQGRVVLTSEYVFVAPGNAGLIARTYYKYDGHGRLTDEIDLVRTVGATEFKSTRAYSTANGLLDTTTTADGVITKYEYDEFLRTIRVTQGLNGTAPYDDQVRETKYDGASRVAQTLPAADTTPTLIAYDTAGRVDTVAEPSPNAGGNLTTDYTYDTKTQTTTGLPTGATRIQDFFLDGRPKSVAGTAQPPLTYTYQATATGLTTTVTKNGALNWGFSETTSDWLGRPTKQSSPGFGYDSGGAPNNIVDRHADYNAAGQLWRERTTYRATGAALVAPTIHTFDAGGRPLWTGLDVDNSTHLAANSSDRIQTIDSSFAQDALGWVNVTVATTYPNAFPGPSAATPKEISRVNARLTGFNNGALEVDTNHAVLDLRGTYLVVADVVTIDAAGRYTVQREMIDRGQQKVRSRNTLQGIGTDAYSLSINGYAALSLSASGVRTKNEYDALGRVTAIRSRYDGITAAESTAYIYHGNTPYVNVATTIGNPSNITATYAYKWGTADGLATGQRRVDVKDTADNWTYTLYNAFDQPYRTWGGRAQPVEFAYNAVGLRTTMTTWRDPAIVPGDFTSATWPEGLTGTGATTTWAHQSASGLLWYKVGADGNATVYSYDEAGRMTYRSWVRRRLNSGLPSSNPESAVITRWVFSPTTGQLTNTNYNDDTDPIPTTDLTYSYTRLGQPYQVTDATGTRTFAYRSDLLPETETLGAAFYGSQRVLAPTYDAAVPGRSTGVQFKNNGATEFAPLYTFNPATGQIATASGFGTTMTYTTYTPGTDWVETITSGSYTRNNTLLANRSVLGKVETKWGATDLGTYDSSVADGFDNRGLRMKITQSGAIVNGTTTAAYNARAEMTGSEFSIGTSKDFTWTLDTMGKRKTAVKNGTTTTYNPAAASVDINEYTSITGSGPDASPESGLHYDLDGNTDVDGTWNYTYDAENRPVQMAKKDGAQTLRITYDYLGRRVRKDVYTNQTGLWAQYFNNIDLSGAPALTRVDSTVDFQWNGASPGPGVNGSNISVRWSGTVTPTSTGTWTISTDSDDGVRLWVNGQLVIDNWTYHGWTTNSANLALVAGKPYEIRMEWFQGGGGAVARLRWSGPGQADQIIPASALRAPQSSTVFVYQGWSLLAELDGKTGAALSKSYLWGPDFSNGSGNAGGAGGLLAVKQGGVTYFPAYDVTGNITGYLNSSTATAKWDYNAFGEILASSGSTSSFAFGFATQYTDRESGLVYYGLRYYNPKHGRFINRDPIAEAGGLNLYSFVGHSPMNAWDVLGLDDDADDSWKSQRLPGSNIFDIIYRGSMFGEVFGALDQLRSNITMRYENEDGEVRYVTNGGVGNIPTGATIIGGAHYEAGSKQLTSWAFDASGNRMQDSVRFTSLGPTAANNATQQSIRFTESGAQVGDLDITLGAKKIGTAWVVADLRSIDEYRGASISVFPKITDTSQQGLVYRWRQRNTIVDENGNFLSWRGAPANNTIDPPLGVGDDKEWYFTDKEFLGLSEDGGHTARFGDRAMLPISGEYPGYVQNSFVLQLVQVNSMADSSGGTVVLSLNWGYRRTPSTLVQIAVTSNPVP